MNEHTISPDVILRSRVRLARNVVDYPFSPILDQTGRAEIIDKVASALPACYTRNERIKDPLYARSLSEENLISREFAAEKEDHALFTDKEKSSAVMVCEEDHLRIQSFADGLDLAGAYKRALETERALNEKIRFAFDPELGYLTHCPTNLGTAMRASVMMFLPALTLCRRMGELKSQLEKIGVTIRGMYGEGSAADAYVYQISNQLSLGLSEDDLVRKVESVACRVAEDEMQARESFFAANRDVLTDKIMRALGILKYATMISGKEFLDCYAEVRLGISLGLIRDVQIEKLDALLKAVMPAHIWLAADEDASLPAVRDKLRAKTVKAYLS